MTNNFREPPRPNYDYDIRRLVRTYEDALAAIQAELNTLALTDFERAQTKAVEENIRIILRDLQTYGNEWAKQTITQASREGVASTIYALGLAETFDEALEMAKLGGTNRALANAMIADTQADLLAVTQNVSRRTRAAVRQATADVMRAKAAEGITGTQSLQQAMLRDIRQWLGESADHSITDSLGRKWKLNSYVRVIAKTKPMEAHLESSINDAIERGVEYGVVSRHAGTCSKCSPWEGRVISLIPYSTGGYPTIEEARSQGLFHPSRSHLITSVRRLDRLPADLQELNEIN